MSMLPRLVAEERQERITDVALGAGNVERHDAWRRLSDLRRAAAGGPRAKASPAVLAAMGIAVTVVEA